MKEIDKVVITMDFDRESGEVKLQVFRDTKHVKDSEILNVLKMHIRHKDEIKPEKEVERECANCKYFNMAFWKHPCYKCFMGNMYEKWEPKRAELN